MKYKVLNKRKLFQKSLFHFEEADLKVDAFKGGEENISRYEFRTPEVIAALLYLKDVRKIVLVEQFRYSAIAKTSGWVLEIIAGLMEKNETKVESLQREVLEESGYEITRFEKVISYFPNVGLTNQFLHFYFAESSSDRKIATGGGLAEEKEDIKVHELDLATLEMKYRKGEFVDSKTIIALQWFFLNKKILS